MVLPLDASQPADFVSICIPTYNGSRYLQACLDSVLNQSHSHFEVVVVDDQSSDDTWDILNRYALTDKRIRLYRNENNLGLVGNWNRCLALARGEWIKFVFQDDWIARDCVADMVKVGIEHAAQLTFCRRELVFEDVPEAMIDGYRKYITELTPDAMFSGKQWVNADEFCRMVLDHKSDNFLGEPTAALIHRDAVARFGMFNPEFIQICDFEYWVRIGAHAGIAYVPETLAYFRVHSNGTTSINEKNRIYTKNTIDPLRLRCEYVYGRDFWPLRQVAASIGKNIKLNFRIQLLN